MKVTKIIMSVLLLVIVFGFQKANNLNKITSLEHVELISENVNQTKIIVKYLVPLSSSQKEKIRDMYKHHLGLFTNSYQYNAAGMKEEFWITTSISQSQLDIITNTIFNNVSVSSYTQDDELGDDGPIIAPVDNTIIQLLVLETF